MARDSSDSASTQEIPLELGRRIKFFMTNAAPPPSAPLEAFLYGLAQPILGARVVLRTPSLFSASIFPALLMAAVCGVCALGSLSDGAWPFIRRFYILFAGVAPLPSLLFRRHYAKMAVEAWKTLGFGERLPRILSLRESAKEWLMETVLIWAVAAPELLFLDMMPFLGSPAAALISFGWALHWVTVNALESARTHPVLPDTRDDMEITQDTLSTGMLDRPAWYARAWYYLGEVLPSPLSRCCRWFGRVLDRLSHHSHEELTVIESHPFLAAGFALTTAGLLAIPGLNLFFRPFTLVGGVHVLGQLEAATDATLPKDEDATERITRPELPEMR